MSDCNELIAFSTKLSEPPINTMKVNDFISSVWRYLHMNNISVSRCATVLEKHGILDIQGAKIEKLDKETAIALLGWAVNAERLFKGVVFSNIMSGDIPKILKRLEEVA